MELLQGGENLLQVEANASARDFIDGDFPLADERLNAPLCECQSRCQLGDFD